MADAKLTPDEKALVRAQFDIWKATYARTGLANSPEFYTALTDLIHNHGYSQTDISWMLGISRERVRQLRVQMGIPKGRNGGEHRIWSPTQERFVNIGNKQDYLRYASRARAAARLARYAQRREEPIEWIRAEKERTGEWPGTMAVVKHFKPSYSSFTSYYCFDLRRMGFSYRDCMDVIFMRAGYLDKPEGWTREDLRVYSREEIMQMHLMWNIGGLSARQIGKAMEMTWGAVDKIVSGETYREYKLEYDEAIEGVGG